MRIVANKVTDSTSLVMVELGQETKAKVERVPTNHVLVIDCSGSMAWELPKIREQIKKKVPKIIEEEDTISVVWFSGRGQFGSLIRAEKIRSLQNLLEVEKSVDRWLKPVGMTGFKDPLDEASRLADDIRKSSPNSALSLWFMSDGCDNEWRKEEIFGAAKSLSEKFDSCVFVEYGYYADRPVLSEMAKNSGGALIFSSDFDQYDAKLEERLRVQIKSAKKIQVKTGLQEKFDFGFYLEGGEIFTVEVKDGEFSVPEGTERVFFISNNSGNEKNTLKESASKFVSGKGTKDQKEMVLSAYGAMSMLGIRAKSKDIYDFLRELGDVKFITQFSKTFGKEKYSEFVNDTKSVFTLKGGEFSVGRDVKAVPKKDAFTSLQLLEILSDSDNNYLLLSDPDFSYGRISRKRVDSNEVITKEDSEKISEITGRLATCKVAADAKILQEELQSLLAKKKTLKFIPNKESEEAPIRSLTFNRSQPNVSLLVRRNGTVDISEKLPSNLRTPLLEMMEKEFPTFKFNNYAIIQGGMGNVKTLPVKVEKRTFEKLLKSGIEAKSLKSVTPIEGGKYYKLSIDMESLPIINQEMIDEVSAKTLCELEMKLLEAQAAARVFGYYSKQENLKKESEYNKRFGTEASEWLRSEGITSYSGFSPKTVVAESLDFIVSKELDIKVKGLSSLPKVEEVMKGKGGQGAILMNQYIEEVKEYKETNGSEKEFQKFLTRRLEECQENSRELILKSAKIKMAVIVGQTWFIEFKTMDENKMTVTHNGNDYECTCELKDKKVKI